MLVYLTNLGIVYMGFAIILCIINLLRIFTKSGQKEIEKQHLPFSQVVSSILVVVILIICIPVLPIIQIISLVRYTFGI